MTSLRKHWLLLAYILISILSLFWSPLLILLMFVFPAVLIVRVRRDNLLYSLFLTFSLNTLFFIFYMAVANLVRIPLYGSTVAYINILFATLLFAAAHKRFPVPSVPTPAHGKDIRFIATIYVLFILAFVARVVSIVKFPAPILHDPVADSVWTKSLLQNHSITYFYSPGLHLITAYFSRATGLSIPHALNLITNSFNALSVLSWGLITLLVTKKRLLAFFVALLTFIVPIPSMLYINSGKNSLVMAIAFVPLIFYTLSQFYKNRNMFSALTFFMSLAALFLIHYPTFGYVLLSVLVLMAIPHLQIVKNSPETDSYRASRLAWLGVALTLLFLVAWFTLQHKGLAENNALSQPINYSQTFSVSLSEFKNGFIANYREFAGYSRMYSSYYMPLMIAGLFYFFAQKRDRYWLAAGVFAFWVATVPFGIRFLELGKYGIIRSSGVLLFFQAFTLIVALAIYSAARTIRLERWSRYVYTLIILGVVGWFSYSQFHSYRVQTATYETVDKSDLAAYSWVNNSHIKGKFLINEVKATRGIFFPSDGGMWVPVYTSNDVSDNFTNPLQTRDANFYKLYSELAAGTNVQSNLTQLVNHGYRYYYYDKGVFGPPINPAVIKPYSTLIYTNSEVQIYRFR